MPFVLLLILWLLLAWIIGSEVWWVWNGLPARHAGLAPFVLVVYVLMVLAEGGR